MNLSAIRQATKNKIAEARARKQQRCIKYNDTCEHDWQRFKQTIKPERTAEQIKQSMGYKGERAYFIVAACMKYHRKRCIELVVER